MELCDRKNMFGDKSTFGSSQVKTYPKKVNKKKYFFFTLNKDPLPTLLIKRKILMELGNETYTFYHLYTFQFKKAEAPF